jgi:putative transposase
LYIAGHKDIFHGERVGYAMAERMTKNLVSESLFRAVVGKRPAKGLVHLQIRGASTVLAITGGCLISLG